MLGHCSRNLQLHYIIKVQTMNVFRTPSGTDFTPLQDRKIYVLWIALITVITIAGFLPDIARYRAEVPPPPFILHFHGFTYSLWLILVGLQIALIEVKKPRIHMQLGWWLVGLSVALVPIGLIAAMVDMARQVAHSDYEPQFLGLEFQSMLVLALLIAAGTLLRSDLAAHKRLMVLAAINLLDPGASRLFTLFSPWKPGGIFGWWLKYFWANALMVLALIAWDLWKRRKVHPALLWGGALLAAGELVAVWLEFAPWWRPISARLVTLWAWPG